MNSRIPLIICLFLAAVLPMPAANVTLAWNPTVSTIAKGYNLYTGTTSGVYTLSNNVGTNTSFTLNLSPGTYYFAVTAYSSNGVESAFSSQVTDTVVPPATLVEQSGGETAISGSTVELSVNVTGVGPITLQWFDGTTPIPGATNSVLALNSVNSASAGNYTVQVSNPGGTVTSEVMTLSVVPLQTAAGTYTGLFAPTNAAGNLSIGENTCGLVNNFVLTSNGMISGNIGINGTWYWATGSFGLNGDGTLVVPLSGSEMTTNMSMSLTLVDTGTDWEMVGVVSNTGPNAPWTAPIVAVRTGQSSIPSFTMNLPLANGTSGLLRGTNVGGVFNLQGTLPDGTAFFSIGAAGSDGTFPLFVNLYTNTGLLAGWVMFSNNIPYGTMTWMRSGTSSGFTNIIDGN